MLCGFCGTEVNPGFYTCRACGATYQKTSTWLGKLLLIPMVGLGFIGPGLILLCFGMDEPRAALPVGVLWIVVEVCLVIVIRRLTKYVWVQTTLRVRN
jgi:hypothetical protein